MLIKRALKAQLCGCRPGLGFDWLVAAGIQWGWINILPTHQICHPKYEIQHEKYQIPNTNTPSLIQNTDINCDLASLLSMQGNPITFNFSKRNYIFTLNPAWNPSEKFNFMRNCFDQEKLSQSFNSSHAANCKRWW